MPANAQGRAIDVWHAETFDEELRRNLDDQCEIIRAYEREDRLIYQEYVAGGRRIARRSNPYNAAYSRVTNDLAGLMGSRRIRAWHYTRMTDEEVALLRRDGILPSTPGTLRARLGGLVKSGIISVEQADRLFSDSPFQNGQLDCRSDMFWMVSHPRKPMDYAVSDLLESWGGEVVYTWQSRPDLQELLGQIGRPRILEIEVPLDRADGYSHHAAEAVIATYRRAIGGYTEEGAFDLCVRSALTPTLLLDIHSEGDESFTQMAEGYPADYVEWEPQE